MKFKRRIEIVTVRERNVRFSPTSKMRTCEACPAHALMLDSTLAAAMTKISLRTLFRWIESGDIHFVETPEGNILLCLDSVQQQLGKAEFSGGESEVVFSHGSFTPTGS